MPADPGAAGQQGAGQQGAGQDGAAAGGSALWNPFANMATLSGHAIVIERGDGAVVYDTRGRAYLDALASLWYCNVGYGRAQLADAAAAQMRKLAAFHAYEVFSNQPAEELASRVAGLVPVPDAKVFFTPVVAGRRTSTRRSGAVIDRTPDPGTAPGPGPAVPGTADPRPPGPVPAAVPGSGGPVMAGRPAPRRPPAR
ncbi:MAG: aminotransferase class III-fold pyridoxal phosphate-dependent enzyme [Streptosporangiaceae bacterium]